jgi:hypothetical protein
MDYSPRHVNSFYMDFLNQYPLQFYKRSSGRWVCIPGESNSIPPYYLGSCIQECIDQLVCDYQGEK